MKLFSISGDASCARGIKGPHHHMLEEFHRYWERIDIMVPHHPNAKDCVLFSNVYFHVAPANKWSRQQWIVEQGKQLIKEQGHQIIGAHDYPPFQHGGAARELTKITGVPHVLELYHIEGHPIASDWKEQLRKLATAYYIKKVWAKAKAIRVINKTQVPQWLKQQGVSEEKIQLLYSSYTDLETFKPRESKKNYDLLYIGRLVGNKGLFDTLKSVKDLPGVSICIVGVGPLDKKLKCYVSKHKLQQRVTFKGWVETNNELAEIINQSRCLVCASRSEGGPRTTIEAMACGVPVISTAVGTMGDVILHRENGLLIDFTLESLKREIQWLLAHPEEAKNIGLAGRKISQQFEKKQLIKEYALAYQKQATAP